MTSKKLEKAMQILRGTSVYLSDPVTRQPITGFRVMEVNWKYKKQTGYKNSFLIEGFNTKKKEWFWVGTEESFEAANATIQRWGKELKKKRVRVDSNSFKI